MKKILPHGAKGPLLAAAAALSVSIAPTVSAHTTIVPNTLNEGERLFADVSIAHGCDGTEVRAMAVGFPSSASMLVKKTDSGDEEVSIDDHLDLGSHGGPRLVQDKNIFEKMYIHERTGFDTVAFHYHDGFLNARRTGKVPFRYTAPAFKPDSCARKVDVLVSIVNWCSKSTDDPARADVWIGRLTDKFNDPAIQPVPFWPRISVYRDLEANPFTDPDKCGEGMDLEWSMTNQEIDALMPIPEYWPANVN